MILHYIKIAFRNLWKYKSQNLISIIGLAVGFVCFAFSALWIRYEMSFDNFHPKADRIYRVHTALFKWDTSESGSVDAIQSSVPYPYANWLKSNFPEIEDAGIIQLNDGKFRFLYLDYSICKIFDLPIPEDFFIESRTDRPVAVTHSINNEETAKAIKELNNWDANISIPDWPANTNIPFNVAVPITYRNRFHERELNRWNLRIFHLYILVKKGVDIQSLEKKLDKIEIPERPAPISFVLTPLKQLRYKNPAGYIRSDIKFGHIQIFAIAGLLVILCSLFNHLTLHVTRIRMRFRELALRKVNGATDRQIAATLYTDFLLVILLSLAVGFILINWLLPTFRDFTIIRNNNVSIYAELSTYAALLIMCSFIAGGIPILYFRKQELNDNIRGFGSPGSRNLFRKTTLSVQLIVSLGMIFCAVVFIKQIRFLHHADLGINRRNIASVQAGCCSLPPLYAEQLKQVPGIIDAIPIDGNGFLRNMSPYNSPFNYVDSTGKAASYTLFLTYADARFFEFFGVDIVQGAVYPNEFDNDKFILNETAMKEMGEQLTKSQNFTGVSRDFHLIPSSKVKPTRISYPDPKFDYLYAIAYKYEEGMRLQTEQAVIQWFRNAFPDKGEFTINFTYMEDVFEELFKAEWTLLKILSVMTLSCILIAVFGVYSLTSLTCQQRRKEIAIRKINGAEVLDILNIFFKEYLLLLALAALVAFPAGYFIMKRWMEGYVIQTSMDAWLFVLIFLIVFVVIVISIVSMVWKAACRNPAEVVKSE